MTKTYDLTTGSLAKHFMRLAIPAAIGMVFSTLYNVVDVFFAGMIGTDAQAGLAISFQAFFIFVTIGFIVITISRRHCKKLVEAMPLVDRPVGQALHAFESD